MPPGDRGTIPKYLAAAMVDVPSHDGWLDEREAARLGAMVFTKRRAEARLGRWTAKRALAAALRLDDDPSVLRRLSVVNATDGAPEAFFDGRAVPVSVSMTDRADWAVCTVIGGDRPIGCDLELVEPRSDAFVADYLTPSEQDLIAAEPDQRDLLANLIWSAKESALKLLRTGLRRDTRSVEVGLTPHNRAGDDWTGLYVDTAEGFTFTGAWRRHGAFVLTYVSATITVWPVPLLDPCPLITATPSHSWMDRPRQPPTTTRE